MPEQHRNKIKAALTALAGLLGGVLGLPVSEEDAAAGTEVAVSVYAAVAAALLWGKSLFDKLTGKGGTGGGPQ